MSSKLTKQLTALGQESAEVLMERVVNNKTMVMCWRVDEWAVGFNYSRMVKFWEYLGLILYLEDGFAL